MLNTYFFFFFFRNTLILKEKVKTLQGPEEINQPADQDSLSTQARSGHLCWSFSFDLRHSSSSETASKVTGGSPPMALQKTL